MPVVIALRSNSARLMTCPQFGQTWTLSHEGPSSLFAEPALMVLGCFFLVVSFFAEALPAVGFGLLERSAFVFGLPPAPEARRAVPTVNAWS